MGGLVESVHENVHNSAQVLNTHRIFARLAPLAVLLVALDSVGLVGAVAGIVWTFMVLFWDLSRRANPEERAT